MTISATTQGLRMGVATSSSRPTVPFDGQVISETDTDSLVVYKGSAWAPVSGLTYITQATPSAVSSVSINNCFTSTYDNYLVTFTTSASVGVDSGLTLRLRASGTDASTNFAQIRLNYYTTSSAVTSNPDGTDEWGIGFVNATNAVSYASQTRIMQPNLAVATRMLSEIFSIENAGANNGFVTGGYQNSTTQFDGFTIGTRGTSFTGTIRVYGYSNS